MPVRSLNSSVLKWPDKNTVITAARKFARQEAAARQELKKLGVFGSYARNDWGVGSDLDLVAVIEISERPFHERPLDWDLTHLPVPAEILVYTVQEWDRVLNRGDRFAQVMATEVVWLTD
jgi:predicted nucleotidyltransferase